MSAQSPEKQAVHAELLEQAKSWDDNKALQASFAELFTGVKEDLVRFVSQSEAMKVMSVEQSQQVQTNYFKSMIAAKINTVGQSCGKEAAEAMNAVKEQLLREVAGKEALSAQDTEKEQRLHVAAMKEISHELERKVAQDQALAASELEQHQRITIQSLHAISEEIRKVVAGDAAKKAMDAEQVQRTTADYFKRMVMGHLAKETEAKGPSPMAAVQAELLKETKELE